MSYTIRDKEGKLLGTGTFTTVGRVDFPLHELVEIYEASYKKLPGMADSWHLETDAEPQGGGIAWSVETADGQIYFCMEKPIQEMFESKIEKVWCYTGVRPVDGFSYS
jgi:hypothetical protein